MRNPSGHKIIVFLPTARATGLAAQVFKAVGGDIKNVLEIHSRKSQSQRTQASDAFRAASTGILFSSDVAARVSSKSSRILLFVALAG